MAISRDQARTSGATLLGDAFAPEVAAHPGQSGFRLLATGLDAFVMRVALAESAQRTLDMQYYIFHADDTGALLTEALLQAADRGVRVRLLVDDYNLVGRDWLAAALDAHPRIEVRVFNPFVAGARGTVSRLIAFLRDPVKLNRRMHNKSFIADGRLAIVGGRNVGNEYFDADRELGFGDLDVLAAGPVAGEIAASFETYWSSESARSLRFLGIRRRGRRILRRFRAALDKRLEKVRRSQYATRLRDTDLAKQLTGSHLDLEWAKADLIADEPAKVVLPVERGEPQSQGFLGLLAQESIQEVILVSPYFVPGERGMASLRSLRARGVRVRILTNSLAATDAPVVHASYRRYRQALLELGAEIHEFKPVVRPPRGARPRLFASARASLHAKAFVFDRRKMVIGSLNLDPRSFFLNTEIGLIIQSEALAGQVAAAFEQLAAPTYSYQVTLSAVRGGRLRWRTQEDGIRVSYDGEPQAGLLRRLLAWGAGLLPIEEHL
ncbi:MAG: phospholipase D family protein [Burkholderiales bacterium]